MKKSYENVAALLRHSTPVTLRSDDFRFSELSKLVNVTIANEAELTIVVGDNLTASEVSMLTHNTRGRVRIVLTD